VCDSDESDLGGVGRLVDRFRGRLSTCAERERNFFSSLTVKLGLRKIVKRTVGLAVKLYANSVRSMFPKTRG